MIRFIFFDGDGVLWKPIGGIHPRNIWIKVWKQVYSREEAISRFVLDEDAKMILDHFMKKGKYLVLLSASPYAPKEAQKNLEDLCSHFGIAKFFDEIWATANYPEAKGEKIAEILKRRKGRPDEAVMIGDSLKWDIRSANRVGVQAILLARQYNKEDHAEAEVVVDKLSKLSELIT